MTGYDDHRFSTICTPQLTSYRVDVDGMANAAVTLLARKLNGIRPSPRPSPWCPAPSYTGTPP